MAWCYGRVSFNSCAWAAAVVPTREYLAVRPLCGRNNIASSLKWVKAAAMLSLVPRVVRTLLGLFRVSLEELMTGFRYL